MRAMPSDRIAIHGHLNQDARVIEGFRPDQSRITLTEVRLDQQGNTWNAHVHYRLERVQASNQANPGNDRYLVKRPTREQRRATTRKLIPAQLSDQDPNQD